MYVVCVTRNKSIAVTTLHSLMTLGMHAAQRQVSLEYFFVEGLDALPKLVKSGERIVWFDYGTNLDQDTIPRVFNTMEKDIKVIVFPAVIEGVDWDMFRKKTVAGSTEPIHQRALTFDTDVTKRWWVLTSTTLKRRLRVFGSWIRSLLTRSSRASRKTCHVTPTRTCLLN